MKSNQKAELVSARFTVQSVCWVCLAAVCSCLGPFAEGFKLRGMARKEQIYWEDSYTGVGQLGENTDATPRDVPLHPGADKWYREHGFKV